MRRLAYVSGSLALLSVLLLAGLGCAQPQTTAPATAQAPAATSGIPPALAGCTVKLDVDYVGNGNPAQVLDLIIPKGDGPFPGLIMIHGGGWSGGDKKSFGFAIPTYVLKGIATFDINYRLDNEAKYPAAVDDCIAAVRWVRAHAAEYKVDPDRLAVMGGSAGGHLALMVGLAKTTDKDLNAKGEQLKSLVVAVASCSGPTDLVSALDQSPDKPPFDAHWFEVAKDTLRRFFGGTLEQMPEKYAEASPVNHVTANMPPTYLMNGTADTLVPFTQATEMEAKLKAAGVPVELVPVEGAGHEAASMYVRPPLVAFLAKHLGVATP